MGNFAYQMNFVYISRSSDLFLFLCGRCVFNCEYLFSAHTVTRQPWPISHRPAWTDPEGGGGDRGSGPPWKITKNMWCPSNIDPDPLGITKLASIQWWAIFGTPAKRHFNDVLQAGRWWPTFSGISILSSPHQLKKKNKKKKLVCVGPPLTKLSGSEQGPVT